MTEYIAKEQVVKLLNTVPPADVVQVVRCKDCKRYKLLGVSRDGEHHYGCDLLQCKFNKNVYFYCAAGEIKE